MRKIQLRKIKLEAGLRKLISAYNLVVSSYELDPMLEEKYQTPKQNMYNKIATCEVMLEPVTGQSSEHDEMGEEIEKPLDLKVTPSMDPTEREFRERLDSMERDDEVPTYICDAAQVWGGPRATEHTKECLLPRRLGCQLI